MLAKIWQSERGLSICGSFRSIIQSKMRGVPCHGNVWWDLNDWYWPQKPISTTMCHVLPTKRYSAKEESKKIVKDWTEGKER